MLTLIWESHNGAMPCALVLCQFCRSAAAKRWDTNSELTKPILLLDHQMVALFCPFGSSSLFIIRHFSQIARTLGRDYCKEGFRATDMEEKEKEEVRKEKEEEERVDQKRQNAQGMCPCDTCSQQKVKPVSSRFGQLCQQMSTLPKSLSAYITLKSALSTVHSATYLVGFLFGFPPSSLQLVLFHLLSGTNIIWLKFQNEKHAEVAE